MNNKNLKYGVTFTLTLLFLLIAGCALSSYLVKTKLAELQSNPDKDSSPILSSFNHKAGFLNSSGTAFLTARNKCYPDIRAEFRVDYTFHHLPLPWAPLRADIKIFPIEHMADVLDGIAGKKFMMLGSASLTPLGAYKINVDMPEIATRNGDEILDIPPNILHITYSKPALRTEWRLPSIEYRRFSNAVTIKDSVLDLDMLDYQKGLGSMKFNINEISSHDMLISGFSIISRMEESGETINYMTSASTNQVQIAGKNFKNMAIELSMNGVDAKSYYTLTSLFQKTCGIQQLTLAESQQATAAVNKILTKGANVNLNKLTLDSADGKFDARLEVALAEHAASEKQISFAKHLSVKGNAELSGNLLPANQVQMLIDFGFAIKKDNKQVASFNFSHGKLTLNGNPASQEVSNRAQEALALFDAEINKMLSKELGLDSSSLASEPEEVATANPPIEDIGDSADTELAPTMETAPSDEQSMTESAPDSIASDISSTQ